MKKNEGKPQDLSRREFVKSTAAGLGATALAGLAAQGCTTSTASSQVPAQWDHEADVVVVGAGATGLPAAITAKEAGASVIVVEMNYDIGGHAIQSGGSTPYGGGTSLQKKYGIEDSPDKFFTDIIREYEYRFSDRDIIRAFCNESAPTFEFLVAHGVVFPDKAPSYRSDTGEPAKNRVAGPVWTAGVNEQSPVGANGTALVRPLEASARKLGVQFLLKHTMTGLVREAPFSGRVLGLAATSDGKVVNIRATRGVILATGGHSSNVNFRRMFDPRLTEEYQVVGEPYSTQPGFAEIAAMKIGGALWGAANQTLQRPRYEENGLMVQQHHIEKPRVIGTRYGYLPGTPDLPKSPIFHLMGGAGLRVRDYQDVVHVNQVGQRFVNEVLMGFPWWDACMAQGTGNGGGPIWAIFDSEAAKREQWKCEPPFVDPNGWFFSGNTPSELASRITNKFQSQPMPPGALEETIRRYNSFVDARKDADFGKPGPKYKVQKPPFYAGWSAPLAHDTLTGLHISTKCEVIDLEGQVIPGLYCGGESAGGFNMHGLGRCLVQGRIAGREAARSNAASQKT